MRSMKSLAATVPRLMGVQAGANAGVTQNIRAMSNYHPIAMVSIDY
jgi:hypothetical protein